jgi:hypothetical protein
MLHIVSARAETGGALVFLAAVRWVSLRLIRLGAFARRGSAAPPRLRTLLPRVAAPDRGSARAAPWRVRAPRLGGSAAPAHAAAARCSTASAPTPDRGSARAAPWRVRAPRLGGAATPAHAAAARCNAASAIGSKSIAKFAIGRRQWT